VVIGGYTLPVGNRRYFNSLLVGYQGPEGFVFAAESALVFRTRSESACRSQYTGSPGPGPSRGALLLCILFWA